MWQDMMMMFAQVFYKDCCLMIKDFPGDPSEYLRRFKTQADDNDKRWSNMAELLELIGLEDDLDYLHEWYKHVVQVTRYVDEYIQRLSRVKNLEKQRTYDVRLYAFVNTIRLLSVTVVDA